MSEVIQRNQQEVKDIAKAMGLVAVLPRRNELLLDLDIKSRNKKIEAVLHDNGVYFVSTLATVSKSGKRHLYIRLSRNISNVTRIALQACLGSDPVREVLSIIRKLEGSDAPTALFETKKELKKVKAWRTEHANDAVVQWGGRRGKGTAVLDDDVPF